MNAGYSGTPLAKKLGLKPGLRLWRDNMPAGVSDEIGDAGAALIDTPEAPIDVADIFVRERGALAERLAMLRPLLAPSGFVRVSWPKKASGAATDVTDNTIREVCLPMGLVDVKICAVDPVWSRLKLMIRKELQ